MGNPIKHYTETSPATLGDPEHIKDCLEKYQPRVVLTFGKVATDAVRPIWEECNRSSWARQGDLLLICPHPAARNPKAIAKLWQAAEKFKKLVKEMKSARV